jgi:fumarate reductase subunit D
MKEQRHGVHELHPQGIHLRMVAWYAYGMIGLQTVDTMMMIHLRSHYHWPLPYNISG